MAQIYACAAIGLATLCMRISTLSPLRMRSRNTDLLESALDPHLLLDLALQLVLLSSTFVERVPRIVDVEPIVILTNRK